MQSLPNPTDGELAILRVLWTRNQACTVREVHDALLKQKDTAYTTVLKMLTIMSEKGLVERDESERSHRYRASLPEPAVQTALVTDLLNKAFSGSALQLVQRALDSRTSSAEELQAISELIAKAKSQQAD